MNNIEIFKLLKINKHKMNKQQYKTIKGQIISGDIEGAKKGIEKLRRDYEIILQKRLF